MSAVTRYDTPEGFEYLVEPYIDGRYVLASDYDKLANSPDLLPPLTASIAIVADRDRFKRERDELHKALLIARRYVAAASPAAFTSELDKIDAALSSLKP